MKRARRWVSGIAVLIASGSCVEAQAPPLAVIVAPPPPVSRPTPLPPEDFVLTGSMVQGGLVIGRVPAGTDALTLDGATVPVAPDGAFVIGFDRDAAAAATLVATRSGERLVRTIEIAPRAWSIARLAGLPKYPVPPADFDRIRPGEIAQINAARRIAVQSDGWRQRMRWPATGRISTLFGSQRVYRNGEAGAYHSGIDIAVPTGTPVVAPADGVVTLAADHPFLLEGNLLLVAHGMGLESAFMHLSQLLVRPGDRVSRGQVIAYSGATGRATGPHLHWGLRWYGAKIDPLLVAGPMPASPP